MIPTPLILTNGSDSGELKLTSDQVGVATLEYVTSKPPNLIKLRTTNELHINFCPPIVGFEIEASPPALSLLEKGDLVVRLLDNANKPIIPAAPRQIDLLIVAGSGEFETNTITIPTNSPSGRTTFHPTHRGTVKIEAACPGLIGQTVKLSVTIPILLLTCAILGGLVGGAMASTVTKSRRGNKMGWVTRMLVGGATGITFYYFLVLGLLPKLPYSAGINPIGAFVLSILGGWLGTEIFTPILKAIGFISKTEQ